MIYTINAVEALHRSLRKIIKTRGSFPNDDAALKLLYQECRLAVAAKHRVDHHNGPVRHSVRLALSGISTMTWLAPNEVRMTEPSMSISRSLRWPEYGRSASSVKAGLQPPPAAAAALTERAAGHC